MAASAAKLPTWYRVLAIIVGVMALVSALIVLTDPLLAVWILILLLALGLLFMGMDRLAAGISGHPIWWVGPMTPPGSGQSTGAAPPPTPPLKP